MQEVKDSELNIKSLNEEFRLICNQISAPNFLRILYLSKTNMCLSSLLAIIVPYYWIRKFARTALRLEKNDFSKIIISMMLTYSIMKSKLKTQTQRHIWHGIILSKKSNNNINIVSILFITSKVFLKLL